ncbi:UbiX family flavin prenyltransferase [Paenibacillus chitinolyticus]|uniref:UbiX family flavin prenyltransferase n=1 Tax=Paenibacillus chitinolyticus TaxID=79263 RepID=UPI002DBD29E1|nr:UbiX family flavin prenyltransferase [Paenibacillus chitinolyticus]MEC0244363.1 UbiX family flavin prenyltransferase [Paenibacillus chitinolyticus]
MKVIVGISGATGAILGIRLLEGLKEAGIETHVVISPWAAANIQLETAYTVKEVEQLADYSYAHKDLGAVISSGSYRMDAMIVAPCSMKTLASIRLGLSDNLIARAADVLLKERKKLVLLTRETPLSDIHLEHMLALSRMGTTIFPPVPAFYNHPQNIEDLIRHIVIRTIDQLGITLPAAKRWGGMKEA